jgi:hypothetical protein
MGLQDIVLKKVLKIVDNTIGKKFKIVDKMTDMFQDQVELNVLYDRRMDDFEKRIKKLEYIFNLREKIK